MLNRKQRVVLAAGVFLVAVVCLFPPYQQPFVTISGTYRAGRGFAFILPGKVLLADLLVEVVAIMAATAGVALLLSQKMRTKQDNHP